MTCEKCGLDHETKNHEVIEILKIIGIDASKISEIRTVGSCPHNKTVNIQANIVRCREHNEIWVCFPLGK